MKKSIITIIVLLTLAALTGCASRQMPNQSFSEFAYGAKQDEGLTAQQEEQQADRLLRQGKPELAFIHYNRAIALNPEDNEVRIKKGELLVRKGLDEQALAEFNKVLAADPDHAMANADAGAVYFRAGLYKQARVHLEKAIRLNPMLWQAHNYLGIVNDRDGDYDMAVANFNTAIELHRGGSTAKIYNNLGVVHIAREDYTKAVDAFNRALKNGDVSSRTYNNLGLALTRLGRLEEALESFKYAGGEAKANNNLGYVLLTDDQPGKAVPYFERAIELSPSFYVKASENLKRARMAARFQTVAAKKQSGSTPNPLHRKSFPDAVQNPGEPAASPASAGSPSRDFSKISHVQGDGDHISTKSYGLHVSSFRDHRRAFRHCAELREQGFETWINQTNLGEKGIWYRVLVGNFSSIREAMNKRPAMLPALGKDRALIRLRVMPAPEGTRL